MAGAADIGAIGLRRRETLTPGGAVFLPQRVALGIARHQRRTQAVGVQPGDYFDFCGGDAGQQQQEAGQEVA